MIREIINFTKNLEENTPDIFNRNKAPSLGLHWFVRFGDDGSLVQTAERGKDFDFYDGEKITPLLERAIRYESYGQRVGNSMNKVLDKKKKLVSCSPFIIAFRKKFVFDDGLEGDGFEKIRGLLAYYLENARTVCLDKEDETGKQWSLALERNAEAILNMAGKLKDGQEDEAFFTRMKDDFYVCVYLDNVGEPAYQRAHETYLKKKLFNTDKYNLEVGEETYGLSNYLNGLNSKKPFLEHKTGAMFKGISARISDEDAMYLNKFELLLGQKVLPRPLPVFVDKKEFRTTDDIVSIFQKDTKASFSQILKRLYDLDGERVLQNYYLLFIDRGEVKDFDFVPLFRYRIANCEIKNLFGLRQKEEFLPTRTVRDIFAFEREVVKSIFNNSLVKIKDESYTVAYFGDVDPNYVSGGEPVYQMILKYRRAFYDYIYKSKLSALNSRAFDEIMRNGILSDLRHDEFKDNRHSKTYAIKDKLNIWFSLYNFFEPNKHKRPDMANKTVDLMARLQEIGREDSNARIQTDEEFAFAVGQLAHYLLNKSESGNRTHALLEPFLQKTKESELKMAIARTFEMYKHAITFYPNRKYTFDRIMADVMGYMPDTKNMKDLLPLILAGYFSETVFKRQNEPELAEA
ncbi:hypothetical protein FUAX_43580 (plasmid) [Fulvitalea axinellae]|uniref:CRISPR-associated protein Csh1 n=1 Tax=Fulvitalea axinellae TaxID=1182444 RepID=A0AAU9CS06_9BACT|nr:hypothetical protein FUAX_43580 [Fulvitalea axinellae]